MSIFGPPFFLRLISPGSFIQRKAETQGPAGDAVLERVQALEAKLAGVGDPKQTDLDMALGQVRRMQTRVALMQPHTVVATIENLVEAAQRAQCKDADYYKQALAEVRRNQDSDGLPELVVHLFGTPESKKVQAAVHAWSKHRKAEVKPSEKSSPATETASAPQYFPPAPPPPAFYPPQSYSYPPQPFHQYDVAPAGYVRRGGSGARRGARMSQARPNAQKCYGCGQMGRRALDCPVLKEFKSKQRI